jgi:hypothetical protein
VIICQLSKEKYFVEIILLVIRSCELDPRGKLSSCDSASELFPLCVDVNSDVKQHPFKNIEAARL